MTDLEEYKFINDISLIADVFVNFDRYFNIS